MADAPVTTTLIIMASAALENARTRIAMAYGAALGNNLTATMNHLREARAEIRKAAELIDGEA